MFENLKHFHLIWLYFFLDYRRLFQVLLSGCQYQTLVLDLTLFFNLLQYYLKITNDSLDSLKFRRISDSSIWLKVLICGFYQSLRKILLWIFEKFVTYQSVRIKFTWQLYLKFTRHFSPIKNKFNVKVNLENVCVNFQIYLWNLYAF